MFLLTQWNLIYHSLSMETLYITYLYTAEDSIGPFDRYLASNPTLPTDRLFPGSNQKSRSSKIIHNLLEEITGEKFYVTHSIRTGVVEVLGAFNCQRFLESGIHDRYFRYETAGDQYWGRVVDGLSQNKPQFSVLPPHSADPHDNFVRECTRHTFSVLESGTHIRSVLELCLASLVKHEVFLHEILPSTHLVFTSYLFRNTYVITKFEAMLNVSEVTCMRPTGISSHVELFQQHVETRKTLAELPSVLVDQ
ncbi:hypothetical protein PHMEG_00023611 [Phytophthora megakarya]|uniref:Uncharacterized protein n=1 Tax=Phytophthora megakarya TaxID=4795 RepID=A0A225VI09_9STRA|nr:hypothetical protein PHMEG_00023611 [Phytophthora megakarya]